MVSLSRRRWSALSSPRATMLSADAPAVRRAAWWPRRSCCRSSKAAAHRADAQPGRSRHPLLRPLPELLHPRHRADALARAAAGPRRRRARRAQAVTGTGVLVVGYGNPLRTDDGGRLARRPPAGRRPPARGCPGPGPPPARPRAGRRCQPGVARRAGRRGRRRRPGFGHGRPGPAGARHPGHLVAPPDPGGPGRPGRDPLRPGTPRSSW
jgi:hypothetical protein